MANFIRFNNPGGHSHTYINIDTVTTMEEDSKQYQGGVTKYYTVLSFIGGGDHAVDGTLASVVKTITAATSGLRL